MPKIRELTITEAENIAGVRLDRRRKYAANHDGAADINTGAKVYELHTETGLCSGCACDCHPGCNHGASGCHECGYTGKRRSQMWIPHLPVATGRTNENQDSGSCCDGLR